MKSLVIGALVGGAAAGALAGMVTGVLFLGGDADDAPPASASNEVSAELARLADELREMRAENQWLAGRLDVLEERPAAARGREPVQPEATPEQIARQQEAQTLAAALLDPSSDLPPAFRESVSDVLQSIRDQEEEERTERFEQRQEERLEERIDELAQQLNLDAYQTGEMRVVMGDMNEKRNEVFRTIRESGDWPSMRETMRDLRDEADERVEQILSPSQWEDYQELRRTESGGFGRGGRGGDRGDRGDDRSSDGDDDRGRRRDRRP